MTSSVADKAERMISSFTSLMSCALSVDGELGLDPLKDSSGFLPRFISPSVSADDACVVIPSLRLKHSSKIASDGASLEESAALNLARTMTLYRKQIEDIPMTLLANLCSSFRSLIDARLRSSIQAFVRQLHQQKDSTLTRVLVGLLACSPSPILPSTIVTSFRTLPACEITPTGEVIMPLVVECIIDLKIFGNLETVTIVAPGTIQTALGNDFMIQQAEIVLDTLAMLQSMMKQARIAVRKAVATGSTVATNLLLPSSRPEKANKALNDNMTRPNKVSSTQELKRQLGAQESSSLMPPPPRRPSKRSLADLSMSCSGDMSGGQQNASWGEFERDADSRSSLGLSLLTAAAGLNGKRSKTDSIV